MRQRPSRVPATAKLDLVEAEAARVKVRSASTPHAAQREVRRVRPKRAEGEHEASAQPGEAAWAERGAEGQRAELCVQGRRQCRVRYKDAFQRDAAKPGFWTARWRRWPGREPRRRISRRRGGAATSRPQLAARGSGTSAPARELTAASPKRPSSRPRRAAGRAAAARGRCQAPAPASGGPTPRRSVTDLEVQGGPLAHPQSFREPR